MNKNGLTLIELLIVIVVIGIIASFSVVNVDRIIRNARASAIVNEVAIISGAARYYTLDVGERPFGSMSGTGTCESWNEDSREIFIEGTRDGTPIDGWSGPYMNEWVDVTPVGGCYVYRNYLVGSQSWARSNWKRFSDDASLGSIAPNDKDIEIIMIRFYPLNDSDTIDESRDIADYLLTKFGEERLFYVEDQAVLGYYIQAR
jgi:prepilin-type N-terminal cleavage/methylation domain-containing protein